MARGTNSEQRERLLSWVDALLSDIDEALMVEFHDRRERAIRLPPEPRERGPRSTPIISHPEAYPHGRCPACGWGVNWAAECPNEDCSNYVPGAEDEE